MFTPVPKTSNMPHCGSEPTVDWQPPFSMNPETYFAAVLSLDQAWSAIYFAVALKTDQVYLSSHTDS